MCNARGVTATTPSSFSKRLTERVEKAMCLAVVIAVVIVLLLAAAWISRKTMRRIPR